MKYSFLAVCQDGRILLVEVEGRLVEFFQRNKSKLFSGKLSELGGKLVADISRQFGEPSKFGYGHFFNLCSLAGVEQDADVMRLFKHLSESYNIRYLVGK
jgi:hypothetical protein